MMYYTDNNVFDASLDRIRMLFDKHGDIIVNMSGGKDSTVVFELALIVAKERGRLPIKVLWLDQEAEWQGTVDYMHDIMYSDYVDPYWFQIPFDFTNSLSNESNYLRLWDEDKKDLWIHPKDDISIKENPTTENRFHKLLDPLANWVADDENTAVLCGVREEESLARRYTVSTGVNFEGGITWCTKKYGNCQRFWPVWDWKFKDVWIAIAKNGWKYNHLYDEMYKYGMASRNMRVSALIHETAWRAIGFLQEFEPQTYKRFERRIQGTSAMNHTLDNELMPRQLPFAFKDWKEYRDYLLEHLVKDEYKEHFRKEWEGQDDEDWYKVHVRECIIQDIDGTLNKNEGVKRNMQKRRTMVVKGE